MNITTAIPPAPVTPNPSIIRLTIRRTATVTPDIGMFEEPTRPVRYPAKALARKAKKIVITAIIREIPNMFESQRYRKKIGMIIKTINVNTSLKLRS